MNVSHSLAIIAVMTVVTILTRSLPFLLFDRSGEPPKVILYLGRVLPPAVMAMLVVYCLRGISFSAAPGWLPQLIASIAVIALHKWKHSTLLSIIGGTAFYMMLVQVVFG